jgi:hypothetical protein
LLRFSNTITPYFPLSRFVSTGRDLPETSTLYLVTHKSQPLSNLLHLEKIFCQPNTVISCVMSCCHVHTPSTLVSCPKAPDSIQDPRIEQRPRSSICAKVMTFLSIMVQKQTVLNNVCSFASH